MTTSTATTLIDRLAATIAHYKKYFSINEEKDRVSHQIHVQEINAQAANWLKEPPHCPIHTNEPMYQLLMETPEHRKGDWMCHECADKIRFARAEQKPKLWSASPTYTSGSVMLAINAQEQAYKQEFINRVAMERVPTLPKNTGEIPQVIKELIPQANIPTLLPSHQNTHEIPLSAHVLQGLAAEGIIPQANVPTAPLAAQDIVYASTPDLDKTIPRLPAISKSTKQIPVIGAEIILMSIKNGPTSPHETGEQEKLPAKIEDGAFLL